MAWDIGQSIAGAGTGASVGSLITGPAAPIGAIVGGAVGFLAPIIGGMIGDALASGDREKANALMEQAVAQYGPDILKQPGIRELTPHLGPSAMESVQADPMAVAAQREALAELQRASRPDNLEFRAATNEAEQVANQQAGAQQGAIQQQLQARGLGGSGVDFALRQAAGQNAANRASGMGFDAAVAGRRNALQALQQYGSLGTTMRGQSFGEGAQRANATDAVSRFNEAGRVAGQQQAFQNNLSAVNGRVNAMGSQAGYISGQADKTQQKWADYGAGVGQAGGTIGQFVNGWGGGGGGGESGSAGSYSEDERRRRGGW